GGRRVPGRLRQGGRFALPGDPRAERDRQAPGRAEVRTARAAVWEAPNAPFVIREYPLRTVREREALVRVTMSTVCRSDIHSYEGRRPTPAPCILGPEITGVVEQSGSALGPDLRGEPLHPGDRVTWTEYFAEGDSYHRDVLDLPQKARGLRKYGHD